jgi:hypothetical protein
MLKVVKLGRDCLTLDHDHCMNIDFIYILHDFLRLLDFLDVKYSVGSMENCRALATGSRDFRSVHIPIFVTTRKLNPFI